MAAPVDRRGLRHAKVPLKLALAAVLMFGFGFASPGLNAIAASIGALVIVPFHWRR